jgi:uncharacterized phage protein (TIGR01671 family)
MREIKFRAWDGIRITTSGIMFNCSTNTLEIPIGSRMKLMQYTGLKDKNGKEIYEGDMVNQEKWISVGVYKPTIGIVKYACCKFYSDCIGEWEGSHADLNGNSEVIGNIYENIELLNDKK